MLVAAALTLFRLTLPALDSTGGCAADTLPCRDLDSLLVVGTPMGDAPRVVAAFGVRGQEGQPFEFALELDGIWTVWVVTQDTHGNVSCASNAVGTNLPPSDVGAAPPESQREVVWFDVQGRRLVQPTSPGVFWRVDGSGVHRVVVLRP